MTFPWIFSVQFGVLEKINPITGYIENNNKKQIPFSGFAASCACAKRQKRCFFQSRSIARNCGRWGARRPGDVGFAPTGAKRRLNPLGSIYASVWKQKKDRFFRTDPLCFQCGRRDLNPHVVANTRSLV